MLKAACYASKLINHFARVLLPCPSSPTLHLLLFSFRFPMLALLFSRMARKYPIFSWVNCQAGVKNVLCSSTSLFFFFFSFLGPSASLPLLHVLTALLPHSLKPEPEEWEACQDPVCFALLRQKNQGEAFFSFFKQRQKRK